MRYIIRNTLYGQWAIISVLVAIVLCLSIWISYTMGSIEGYRLGVSRSDTDNPFKAYIESGKPFVYDRGVIYRSKMVVGKKSPYYIINSEAK